MENPQQQVILRYDDSKHERDQRRSDESNGFREYESSNYELTKLNRTGANETSAFREDEFNECELTELNRADTKEASEFRENEFHEYELTKLT